MSVTTLSQTDPLWSTIQIPREYDQLPILSYLTSRYGLTVNITGANLNANSIDDGWFDLKIRGTIYQQQAGLRYLRDLEVQLLRAGPKHILERQSNNTSRLSTPEVPQLLTSTSQRIKICIPANYRHQPLISNLTQYYGLTYTILNAVYNGVDEGWFDLILWGYPSELQLGIDYLKQQKLDLWKDE
jgi:hypothetical protein